MLNHRVIGDPQQPWLIFLHGFLGCGDDFAPIAQALPDCCAILIDLPGHGHSLLEDDAAYAMPATARSVIELLAQLGPKPKTSMLYGYSMGGRLGLYLALTEPQWFDRVILESTSAGLKTALERQARIVADRQWIEQLQCRRPMPEFLKQWYAQPIFQRLQQHPNFAALIHQRRQNQPQYLAKSLMGMGLGQQPYLGDRLPQLSMPVQFLAGEFDPKFIAIQTELVGRSPQAHLKVIPHAGHNIHWEQPDAVIREIANFAISHAAYNA